MAGFGDGDLLAFQVPPQHYLIGRFPVFFPNGQYAGIPHKGPTLDGTVSHQGDTPIQTELAQLPLLKGGV